MGTQATECEIERVWVGGGGQRVVGRKILAGPWETSKRLGLLYLKLSSLITWGKVGSLLTVLPPFLLTGWFWETLRTDWESWVKKQCKGERVREKGQSLGWAEEQAELTYPGYAERWSGSVLFQVKMGPVTAQDTWVSPSLPCLPQICATTKVCEPWVGPEKQLQAENAGEAMAVAGFITL